MKAVVFLASDLASGMTAQIAPDTLGFFTVLAADNGRAFWQSNKARMEAEEKAPFAELIAALEPRFGPFKTFRMNRDIPFLRRQITPQDHDEHGRPATAMSMSTRMTS